MSYSQELGAREAVSDHTLVLAQGDECPEGIFYPADDTAPSPEWRAKAMAAAAASWRVIGGRPVKLSQKWVNLTVHALRTRERGYGEKRRHWRATTECGQIMRQGQGWEWRYGFLRDTTCLSCRKVVREGYERDVEYDIGGDGDRVADEWDQVQRDRIETIWRIQAEWHKPDPDASEPVPSSSTPTLTMSREDIACLPAY